MAQTTTNNRAIWALRGNCMATAVGILVEFGIGMGLNLYVTLPAHKAFFSTVFGEGVLTAHVLIGVLLVVMAISALVRAIRLRRAIVWTALGALAILVAMMSGSGFVSSGDAASSMSMALAAAVALFSYLVVILRITPAS